ncbi:protein translocase subunit SecD [Pengzhenrongella frigida]|uniref:protein translocase subunit SecD n=1 Tax=Pengzhenrongella frigida TaxID=1259133 RepID=UPI003D9C699A
MAATPRRSRPIRTLVTFAVITAALFGSLVAGTFLSDATMTPKLALDLEGGTQLILKPVATGDTEITSETIAEAIRIIRQRVDSSGVAEAEITSQGGSNIVVALPGTPDKATLDLVRTSAQMRFRPVLAIGAPAVVEPAADATPITPKAAPDSPSDAAYYVTDAVLAEFNALDCADPANLAGGESGADDAAFVTCDADGTAKYILGPVEIQGNEISTANSGQRTSPSGAVTGEWVVNIEFTSDGRPVFRDVTTRLQALTSPQNQFAMVLDGLVISAPSLAPGVIISDGKAEISGTFTRVTAASLANQLNFGALPLTFQVQSEEQISATLGSEQLQKGLLAGLIGLLLVVVYSLFQYRALGLVTVASLVISAVLVYGVITLLSWLQGYRLSLPGVAALIVAIGIIADSFIVYFERVRDELRDGRSLVGAVDKGWDRARRTILASDAVNFLAAIVLYFLAVGGVRGFAFTLGLTTIIDLVVVFLFTHPVMLLLARTKFFGEGHKFSGLDPRRLGATGPRYAGRGKVSAPSSAASPGAAPSDDQPHDTLLDAPVPVGARVAGGFGDDSPRQTIAERRAAQRAAELGDAEDGATDPADASPSAGTTSADGPPTGDPAAPTDPSTERNES